MFDEDKLRKDPRVRDDIPVIWSIAQANLYGQGVFRNLSISGALLETKVFIPAAVQQDFPIELKAFDMKESSFVPAYARIVWSRPVPSVNGYYFFGLQFLTPGKDNLQALEQRVGDRLDSLSSGMNMGVSDRNF
jgi:hypothetical protein